VSSNFIQMKKLFFSAILSIALFSSCSTDLDVLAPYKDITTVYGLLNQNDTIHFIRINKAFLGKEDAGVMAQVPDSAQYAVADLEVKIEEYINQKVTRTFILKDTIVTNKEQGYFYAPNQLLYYFTTDTTTALNQDAAYLLVINNKKNGQTIYASYNDVSKRPDPIQLVNRFSIVQPTPSNQAVPLSFMGNSKQTDYTIKWVSAKDGLMYDLKVDMFYMLIPNTNTSDTIQKVISWKFNKILGTDLNGTRDIEFKLAADVFYGKVLDEFTRNSYTKDIYSIILDTLNLSWNVAGSDLATYVQVADPGTSIIQERPSFSNIRVKKQDGSIENAVGIFSSRYNQYMYSRAINRETAEEVKKLAAEKNINITKVRTYQSAVLNIQTIN
jgi:hypothetical protein